MKKMLVWFLTLSILLSLMACGDKVENYGSNDFDDANSNNISDESDIDKETTVNSQFEPSDGTEPEEDIPQDFTNTQQIATIKYTECVNGDTNNMTREFIYDENGLSQIAWYQNGDVVMRDYFDGDLQQHISRNYKDRFNDWKMLEFNYYDERGNIVKEEVYGGIVMESLRSGEIGIGYHKEVELYFYSYDLNGNRLSEMKYDPDGNVESSRIYEYDNNGNVTKMVSIDSTGDAFTQYYNYEYDENNNITIVVGYFEEDDAVTSNLKETYKYDESQRIIEHSTEYLLAGSYSCYTYEYNENGEMIAESHSGPYSDYKKEWKYNDLGQLVEVSECQTDEIDRMKYETKCKYEYDDCGNVVQCYEMRQAEKLMIHLEDLAEEKAKKEIVWERSCIIEYRDVIGEKGNANQWMEYLEYGGFISKIKTVEL